MHSYHKEIKQNSRFVQKKFFTAMYILSMPQYNITAFKRRNGVMMR